MAAKFELYQDKAGEFRFRLKAANGQVIATSEGYKTKASCLNGIESVRTNAPKGTFEEYEDKAGEFRFRLKAANAQVIAVSEGYKSKAACQSGIESVKTNAPVAELDDQTKEK